jgi:membrane-bound ClpP family serine protease
MSVFSFIEGIGPLQTAIFILGLILLIIEIFAPGFGFFGGSGIALLILGIILTARNTFEAVIMVIILLLLAALVLFIILRSAKKGKLSKKLILWSAAKKESGYSASSNNDDLIGKEGIALTVLRPAGLGEFDGNRIDIVTDGTYIEEGTRIKIIRIEGNRIVVKKIKQENNEL